MAPHAVWSVTPSFQRSDPGDEWLGSWQFPWLLTPFTGMELRLLSHRNLGDTTFVWCPFIHLAVDLLLTFHLGQTELGSNIGFLSNLQVFISKGRIDGSSNTSTLRSSF
jgi:hypothetical protein